MIIPTAMNLQIIITVVGERTETVGEVLQSLFSTSVLGAVDREAFFPVVLKPPCKVDIGPKVLIAVLSLVSVVTPNVGFTDAGEEVKEVTVFVEPFV